MKNAQVGYDVLVVGAGAAGLAAAVELTRHGRTVCVLEARDRVGGRILTRREPDVPIPLELGAEFIHGMSRPTLALLETASVAVVDTAQAHWVLRNGKLEPADDVFDEMRQALRRVPLPQRDVSFAAFLEGPARRKLPARVREFARLLVEGFDAADAARVSTLETLEEWNGAGAADAPTFRPQGGYAALIEAVSGAIDRRNADVRLYSVVEEVAWRRGRVTIKGMRYGAPFAVDAPRAVIALPLGVLELPVEEPGAVRFSPALAAKRAAFEGLASGPVVKVLLRFRAPFWEALDGERYRDAAFFHGPRAAFPTFWTSLPVRSTVLTAWAAGPNALRLAGADEGEIVSLALRSLDSMFGGAASCRGELEGAYVHDWRVDPFARGAYSYVTVGGGEARATLAQPLEDTLFFAGEAADTQGEAATVGGALRSGVVAAQQALAQGA